MTASAAAPRGNYDIHHPETVTFHDRRADFLAGHDSPRDYLERCLNTIDRLEPTVQAWVACYAFGTPLHSWQMVSQGQSALAHAGMVHAAQILAATAIVLLEQPELIEKAKAELLERRGGQPYVCPIPADAPLPSQPRAAG